MNDTFTRRAFLKISGAALTATVVSPGLASPAEAFEGLACPTDGKENFRNSEGSLIGLPDGSLLLAYTRFRGGSSSDSAPADIVTRRSADFGRTWTEPSLVSPGKDGNMCAASLLRLGGGAVAMFYGRDSWRKGPGYTSGNWDDVSEAFVKQVMRVSDDRGQTWSEERALNPAGEHSQVLLNDSARRLSTGRIILPNYHGLSPYSPDPEFVQPLLSDDDGKTWFPSRFRVCVEVERGGMSEASVAERADGSLLMTIRSQNTGFVYRSESRDVGETWSKPESTGLPASGTPTSLRRMPQSDDLVLLWNQVSGEERKWGFARHRLTAAVSSDGGRTWRHRRNLESLNDRTYIPAEEAGPGGPSSPAGRVTPKDARLAKLKALGLNETGIRVAEYSSLIFVDDKAVITYDVGGPALPPGASLKLRVLPISWFYENK